MCGSHANILSFSVDEQNDSVLRSGLVYPPEPAADQLPFSVVGRHIRSEQANRWYSRGIMLPSVWCMEKRIFGERISSVENTRPSCPTLARVQYTS